MVTEVHVDPELLGLDPDDAPLPDRLMRMRTMARYMDYEYRYVKETLIKDPRFPKPYRVFNGQPRWRMSEIDAFLELWRDD